jgi:hypothetical protein
MNPDRFEIVSFWSNNVALISDDPIQANKDRDPQLRRKQDQS